MTNRKKFTIEIALVDASRLKHSEWHIQITDEGTQQCKAVVSPMFPTNDEKSGEYAYNSAMMTLSDVIGRRIVADIELLPA